MKVTIFSAVRQALPCFHQTLRENNRSFVQFFWTEISRPIFLEILIIEQGSICTFFKTYCHNSPLPDICKFGHFWNFLRTTQRAHYSTCTCIRVSSWQLDFSRNATKKYCRIPFEHRERIVRTFEDVKRDEARRQGIVLWNYMYMYRTQLLQQALQRNMYWYHYGS